MKKKYRGVKTELRNYIDSCEERIDGYLNKENWKGLRDIINEFTHKIYINNDETGHKKRQIMKTELIEYSIEYLNSHTKNRMRIF